MSFSYVGHWVNEALGDTEFSQQQFVFGMSTYEWMTQFWANMDDGHVLLVALLADPVGWAMLVDTVALSECWCTTSKLQDTKVSFHRTLLGAKTHEFSRS